MKEELRRILLMMNDFSAKNNCEIQVETYKACSMDKEYSAIIYDLKAVKDEKIIASATMKDIKVEDIT